MAATKTFSAGGKGRMALALAIALGLHYLLLSALPQHHAPAYQKDKTVRVTLASTGQEPLHTPVIPIKKPAKAVDTLQKSSQENAQGPTSAPVPEKVSLSETSDTPTPEDSPTAPSKREKNQHTGHESASLPQETLSRSSSQTSHQGEEKETSPENNEHQQESTDPQRPQLSPYELAIRHAIAREIRFSPSMAELDSPRRLRLEIELMGNGILQRARVTESSGDNRLDYQARQAALIASPFPAIPEEQHERRFELELRFTPGS